MEKRRLMAEVTPQTPNYYLLSIICYLFLFHGADFVNILQKIFTSVNLGRCQSTFIFTKLIFSSKEEVRTLGRFISMKSIFFAEKLDVSQHLSQ